MGDRVRKEANNLKRALKNDITLESLEIYARKLGFTLCFFGDGSSGDKKLKSTGCESEALSRSSFLIISKYDKLIFVNSKRGESEKIELVLHEVGHIVLCHADCKKDSLRKEIEADAFVYEVLYRHDDKAFLCKFTTSVAAVAVVAFLLLFVLQTIDTNITVLQHSNQVFEASVNDLYLEEYYYITPQGDKYHKPTCRYVKNKECAVLAVAETAAYEPCSVCIK